MKGLKRPKCLLLFLFTLLFFTAKLQAQTQLTVSMSTTPACSADGTASVTVTGGTPPYSYSWYSNQGTITSNSSTLTGLPGGYYSVWVTDNVGNFGSMYGTVARPFQPQVSATDEMCGDGTGTATATVTSGGTPPFTYLWNNGGTTPTITGLHAGGYHVTITDANGCFVSSFSDSGYVAFVGNGSPLTYGLSTVGSTCSNGTVTATNFANGTPPYTYFWATTPPQFTQTATGIPGGTYGTVLVTDAAGCMTTNYFYVNQLPNGLSLSFAQTNETCSLSNGAATANVSGGTAPYTYLWSNGATTQTATGLSVGAYSVTVTDANACPKTGTVYIQRISPISISFSATQPSCSNQGGSITATASGGTPPYTYHWNNNATTNTISGLSSGYYAVYVTDASGCVKAQWYNLTPPSACFGNMSGYVLGDLNNNCVHDAFDFGFDQKLVAVGPSLAWTNSTGYYNKSMLAGTYVISEGNAPNYFALNCPAAPGTITVNNLTPGQLVGNLDFYNMRTANVSDLKVSFFADPARPTAPQQVSIYYRNVGSQVQNATIHFVHDPLMSLVSGGFNLSSYNLGTRTLTYNLGPIAPGHGGTLNCTFSIPTSTVIGTPYVMSADIQPIAGDANPTDNQQTTTGAVITAYDPNAKSVFPDGALSEADSVLTYMIQFQNTGNDTAFTVAIEDAIDPSLDIFSLEILGASHPYTLDADAPNIVRFIFENIMLPDSNINEPLSHGHIMYRVHLKPNLPQGTQIHNTAAIYFDYNTPVMTNTTLNTLGTVDVQDANAAAGFTLFPNPAKGQVYLRLADTWDGATQVNVRDLSGRLLQQFALDPAIDRQLHLDVQGLSAGVYLVECVAEGQRSTRKLVLQ